MRRLVLTMPLLLAACAGHWPTKPYVQMTDDSDAAVLTAALVNCIVEIASPGATLSAPPDTLSADLTVALQRHGLTLQPTAEKPRKEGVQAIGYVAAPLGTGEFVRVAEPRAVCSQYLARTSTGTLRSDGPLMVQLQND